MAACTSLKPWFDFTEISERPISELNADDLRRLRQSGVYVQRDGKNLMLRAKVPAGALSPEALATAAHLAENFGDAILHLTTRQDFEFHGLKPSALPHILTALNGADVTTNGACGDTVRNIVSPICSGWCANEVLDATPLWHWLYRRFLLNPDELSAAKLPRKFKIYLSSCRKHAGPYKINDLGLVPAANAAGTGLPGNRSLDSLPTFELWLGGGLGAQPRLGILAETQLSPLDVPAACVAAVELHRIHSSPTRRMHARLKFLVEDWGAEKFLAVWRDFFQAARATVGRPVAAEKLQPTAPMASNREFFQAWLLAVPNGDLPAAAAFDLADLARKFQAKIRLNCDQNLVFVLADAHTSSFQAAAKKLGFVPFDCAPKKNVIACMGAPLCRRALADAKHAANLLAACLRAENLVLPDDAVIAISGCPNNCAGHSIAEFGFSGFKRTVNGIQSERYVAFLGGSRNDGGRLGHRTEKRLPPKELGPFIKEILERDGKPR